MLETKKSFTTADVRLVAAHETVKDYGANYLNPLIGKTAQETCANVESVISFLHGLIDSDDDLSSARPGIALVLQTVWTAVQYERDVGAH